MTNATNWANNLPRKPLQSFPTKLFHWINVASLAVMMMSGLQIYNANPVFGGRSGWHILWPFTMGGWLAGGRHLHFAAMNVFALNLLAYGVYVIATRRWRHRFVGQNDLNALNQSRNPKRRVYAWHRIAYTAIIPILLGAIVTGIGMYKPAQFPWIAEALGGWFALRVMHLMTVPAVVGFAIMHSILALKAGGDRLVESMLWDGILTEEPYDQP
jgi:thiosulfate reductase cytochrome b subunit